jgi:predicted TIM-barrel fold metal-dependent hydrolase
VPDAPFIDTRPLTDPPDPHPRKPALVLPPGAWDCLIHVYGPPQQYPFHPLNPYRSDPALPETYIRQQDFLGLSRAVIANGAGYGADSRYLLETLARFPGRFVGVTYVEENVKPAQLKALRSAGVVGCRFAGGPAYTHLPKVSIDIAATLADAGMHVEYLTFTPGGLAVEKDLLLQLPTKLVIDHFGKLDAAKGLNDPGFTALLELLDTGRVWVKLSNPGFCTREDFPFAPMTPYARKLVAHAPDRVLWGSNWPHVMKMGRAMPNDGDLVDLIAEWAPDERLRQKLMVANPSALYLSH